MAAFVTDSFTDTDNTTIVAHTGELGATWTKHGSMAGNTNHPKVSSNAIVSGDVNSGVNSVYYASGTPASQDYSVTVPIFLQIGASGVDAPGLRIATGAGNGYFAALYTANGQVALFKWASGSPSIIGTAVNVVLSGKETYTVTLSASGTSTTALTVRVQRASDSNYLTSAGGWSATQQNCITHNDTSSPITAAGRPALWINTGSQLNQWQSFSADESGGGGTAKPHHYYAQMRQQAS